MNTTLKNDHTGVALIEFALTFPLLLLLLLGISELANYTLHHQKLDKLSSAMADFVAQGSSVSTSDLSSFAVAVPQIMRPYSFDGTVIFTSASRIRRTGGGVPAQCRNRRPCVDWQYRILGTDSSQIGAPNTTPSFPGGYTLQTNQNVIVAEAYLNYRPLLSISANFVPAFTPQKLYKVTLTKPRQGTLTTLQP